MRAAIIASHANIGVSQPASANQKLAANSAPPIVYPTCPVMNTWRRPNRSLALPQAGLARKNTIEEAAMIAPI